jgi:hypothetical protein
VVRPSQIVREEHISVADLSPHNGDAQEIIVLVKAYLTVATIPLTLSIAG